MGGLIFRYLKEEGYDVHIIKDKIWTKLSDRINVLCLCDYNQDAVLLIDINGRLIINMNDGSARGWKGFIQNIVKDYQISFYLRLHGYGDADMFNFFDEEGSRIPKEQPSSILVGPYIARDIEQFGAKFFIPFRWDSKSSEILPAFIRYDCMNDTWEKINPTETLPVVLDPKDFGDDWGEQLDKSDIEVATKYFCAVYQLTRNLDFISLRIGGKDNIIELGKRRFNKGIMFEAPRHSLMLAVQYEIFDDMLIGNFMKTTLHGKLKSDKPTLYPYFSPYVPKYADNGRAKSKKELDLYFKEYRKRLESRKIIDLLLVQKFEARSKNFFGSYISQNSVVYKTAKRVYYAARRTV
jgi:hypothetical protein